MSQCLANPDLVTSLPYKLSKRKCWTALLSSLSDSGKEQQLKRQFELLQDVHHAIS